MRIFFLCLLLVVGVDGGIFKDLIDKIKGSIKTKLQKDLNVTLNLYKKLKEYGSKVKNMLKLTPKMLKSLKEKLKKVRLIVRDKIAGDDGSIDEINEKSGIGEYLYQGDMILSEKQAEEILENIEEETSGGARNRTKRQAFKDSSYLRKLWSQGVPYFFDYETTNDRLRVVAEDGCWSYVGKNGGEQSLSLGRGCEHVGVAVHELGHALGFFHTMSRYDRDAYITVIERNIKSGWRDQFTKESPQTNYNYGFGYDYGSVMHYGSHSPEFSAKCKNGGFPHPRNCSRCICPSGYGGALCNERPHGCGAELQAASNWQKLQDTLGFGREIREDFKFCNYWIKSPNHSQIEVKIVNPPKGVAVDGCYLAGVEIKTNRDQTHTGYRFCAKEDAGLTLTSHSDLVPVVTYNRIATTTVELEYRIANKLNPTQNHRTTGRPGINPRSNCVDNNIWQLESVEHSRRCYVDMMDVPNVYTATRNNISDDSSQDERSQIYGLEEDQGIRHNEEVVVSPYSESDDGLTVDPHNETRNGKSTTMLNAERPTSVRSVRFSEKQANNRQTGPAENQSADPSNGASSEYEEALNLPASIAYPPSSPPAYQSPPTMPKSEEHKPSSSGRSTLNDLIMSKVTLPFQQMMKRSGRPEEDSDSDSHEYSDSEHNAAHDFSQEEEQLFAFVDAYQPEEIRPRPLLRLFLMDYMPAIGDIDAMIKIPRPDEVEDNIGFTQLDEPAIQQSDPTILKMQLLRANKDVAAHSDTPVKRLERADKSTHEIDKWIANIKELHRSRPPQTVLFRHPMPDIETLMQEFDPAFEKAIEGKQLPTADLDVDLEEYADICLNLLDIPVYNGRIQSLHCLFSLYQEFKNSQHFKNLAQNAAEHRETTIDRMEL
ncbi:hypothetical protein RB195_008872 [Necator americanus]|uniref:Metalloendopeptidase n=1 Tax=Necator americanus TaxID=51031 RepID=A0ABR1CSJ6_NECAM